MYKLIIFDCDGTLLYTIDDLTDSINYAMRKLGLNTYSPKEVLNFVGNGIGELVKKAIGQNNLNLYDKAIELFKSYYAIHFADKTIPYKGILEMLNELKSRGFTLALVSNKNRNYLDLLYNKYFSEYISVCLGESEDLQKKPAPDMVEYVLNLLNISKKDAIYIGDSEVDFQTAKNSGLGFIAVTWGYRTKEYLISCGAENFIDTPREMLEYFKN